MSDPNQDLVARAAGGDRAAIESLLEIHLPGLRAFIRLRAGQALRQKESTSDLAQSVCREILEHLERFKHGDKAAFKHWLYSTALRKIKDRARYYLALKRDARREVSLPAGDAAGDDSRLLECYSTVSSPSGKAIAREEMALLEAAFDRLPNDYKQVILLSRIVGLSHEEIARELGCTEVAIRKLLSRALARLLALLGKA
jgi:RNA polymerase sigma-70 factor (ECF subfamily)